MALSSSEIAIIKGMLARGDRQHDIAAYFGINGGRVGEINTGQRGEGIEPAPQNSLPPPGPYLRGRSSEAARDTLIALRDLIDQTIQRIETYERVPRD